MNHTDQRKVPKFIAKKYELGARGFKSEKRQQLRMLNRILSDLRIGCAYLPCGTRPVDDIQKQINIMLESLSVKNWGR